MKAHEIIRAEIQSYLNLKQFQINDNLRGALNNYYFNNSFIDYLRKSETSYLFKRGFLSPSYLTILLNKEFGYSIEVPKKEVFGVIDNSTMIDFAGNRYFKDVPKDKLKPSINVYLQEKKFDYTLKVMEQLIRLNKDKELIVVEIGCNDGARILPTFQEIAQKLDIKIKVIGIEIDTLTSIVFSKKIADFPNLVGECLHSGLKEEVCVYMGKFIEYISNENSQIILSSQMATDPYVPFSVLRSFVEPFVQRIIGCVAYELDGMMLLTPSKRVSFATESYKKLKLFMYPPQVWGLGDPEDDYFNIENNREPNTFLLHKFINSKRKNLQHTWKVPLQVAYSHPGYYSILI